VAEEETCPFFPAVSDEATLVNGRDLASVQPGGRLLWQERLWAAMPSSKYGKGALIGTVDINHLRTATGDRVFAEAIFSFQDSEGVECSWARYEGWVPGGDAWQGKSWFSFVTGSLRDDSKEWPRRVMVESENPKRWGT
jgi:hypothetical protein